MGRPVHVQGMVDAEVAVVHREPGALCESHAPAQYRWKPATRHTHQSHIIGNKVAVSGRLENTQKTLFQF